MGKSHQIIFGLLLFSIQALGFCPKDRINLEESYLHTCDGSENLILRQRLIKDDLAEVDHFEPGVKRPFKRDVYISKYAKPASYEFTYLFPSGGDYRIKQTDIYDFKGSFLGSHKIDVDFSKVKSSVYKKPKALIIDSGFNWTHKDLVSKIYFNSKEKLNGMDDDGDGVIDNITTLNGTLGRGGSVDYKANIQQVLQLPTKDAPLSHGGYVASVSMKGVENYSFMGVGGDIYSPVYLYKMLDLITKNDLKFANMSFGFGDKAQPIIIGRESFDAISGIMMSAMQTLFVVAAGNGSIDFDESKYSEYPACFKFNNLITVGALDTDEIIDDELETYKIAHFSNRGERCVDLYAPGVKVEGAGLVNTRIKASGTSVSSPYVLNVLLKMHELNEELSPRELKVILMKTAYVPEPGKLPSRSGGIVRPNKAYEVVELTKSGMSTESALEALTVF